MTDPRKDSELQEAFSDAATAYIMKTGAHESAAAALKTCQAFMAGAAFGLAWQAALASRPLSQEGRDAARLDFLSNEFYSDISFSKEGYTLRWHADVGSWAEQMRKVTAPSVREAIDKAMVQSPGRTEVGPLSDSFGSIAG